MLRLRYDMSVVMCNVCVLTIKYFNVIIYMSSYIYIYKIQSEKRSVEVASERAEIKLQVKYNNISKYNK